MESRAWICIGEYANGRVKGNSLGRMRRRTSLGKSLAGYLGEIDMQGLTKRVESQILDGECSGSSAR
jgi:hypothetical protein